jgi:hypothetical protein
MASRHVVCTAAALLVLLTLSPAAAPKFGIWQPPVNLGPLVNSSATDSAPSVSKKGTSLYFNSNRTGGLGAADLWVTQRSETTGTWGLPLNLGPVVNGAGIDASPVLSRDEHWLFFHSSRGGTLDIWVSYREHTHDDFAWQPPVNLGSGVNSTFEETMGGFFENDGHPPQLFFSSNRPGVGAFDFYVSELLANGTFGPATLITALSSTAAEPALMVSFDGLEAFFSSGRPGGSGGQDSWTATRVSVSAPWSAPVNLGPVINTAGIDGRPYIASDRETLFFASDRAGGSGGQDLYLTTRTRR